MRPSNSFVSTTLGAEGLTFEDGREIILRDGVAPLAEECVRLLRDPAAAERLGVASREKVRITYDQRAIVAETREAVQKWSAAGVFPAGR